MFAAAGLAVVSTAMIQYQGGCEIGPVAQVSNRSHVFSPASPQGLFESVPEKPARAFYIFADTTPTGERRSATSTTRVEIQVLDGDKVKIEEKSISTAEKRQLSSIFSEDPEPALSQSYQWMRPLALNALFGRSNAEFQDLPASSLSDMGKIVIIKELSDQERQETRPPEERAQRAIHGILGV